MIYTLRVDGHKIEDIWMGRILSTHEINRYCSEFARDMYISLRGVKLMEKR